MLAMGEYSRMLCFSSTLYPLDWYFSLEQLYFKEIYSLMSKFISWLGCLLYFLISGLPLSQLYCFLALSTEGLRTLAEVSSNILNGVSFKDCSFFSDSETPIMINLLSSVNDSSLFLTFKLHSCVLSNFLNSASSFSLNLSVYFSLYCTVLESRLMRSLRESSSQTFSFTICLRILSQRVNRQPQ